MAKQLTEVGEARKQLSNKVQSSKDKKMVHNYEQENQELRDSLAKLVNILSKRTNELKLILQCDGEEVLALEYTSNVTNETKKGPSSAE